MKELILNQYKLFHIYLMEYHTATDNDVVELLKMELSGEKKGITNISCTMSHFKKHFYAGERSAGC